MTEIKWKTDEVHMLKFKCRTCGTYRPYGTGESYVRLTTEETPVLSCETCKKPTEHTFEGRCEYLQTYTLDQGNKMDLVKFTTKEQA